MAEEKLLGVVWIGADFGDLGEQLRDLRVRVQVMIVETAAAGGFEQAEKLRRAPTCECRDVGYEGVFGRAAGDDDAALGMSDQQAKAGVGQRQTASGSQRGRDCFRPSLERVLTAEFQRTLGRGSGVWMLLQKLDTRLFDDQDVCFSREQFPDGAVRVENLVATTNEI